MNLALILWEKLLDYLNNYPHGWLPLGGQMAMLLVEHYFHFC